MKWGCSVAVSAGLNLNIMLDQFDCWLNRQWRSVFFLSLCTEVWWDHCAPSGLSELHPVPGHGQLQRPWKYHIWNQSQVCGEWQTLAGFFFFLSSRVSHSLFTLFVSFPLFSFFPSSVENVQRHLLASGDLVPVCLCGVDLYGDSKSTDYFLGLNLNEFHITTTPIWPKRTNIFFPCMSQCMFAHSLRKFSMRDWGIEQKWMSILLPLLLLYNGELQHYLSSSQVFFSLIYPSGSTPVQSAIPIMSPFNHHSCTFLYS